MKYETEQERRASAARSIFAALRRARDDPHHVFGDPLERVRRERPAAAGLPDAVLVAAAARAAGNDRDPWCHALAETSEDGRLPDLADPALRILLGEPSAAARRMVMARLKARLRPARLDALVRQMREADGTTSRQLSRAERRRNIEEANAIRRASLDRSGVPWTDVDGNLHKDGIVHKIDRSL